MTPIAGDGGDDLAARGADEAGIDDAYRVAFVADFRARIGRSKIVSEAAALAFKLTPAEARDRLDRLANALRQVERELERAPELFSRWAPDEQVPDELQSLLSVAAVAPFATEVSWWRQGAERLRDAVVVKGSGRRHVSGDKEIAALAAYSLLKDHGGHPTTTGDGPFVRLTEVVFEALTGRRPDRRGEGLEAACKAMIASERRPPEGIAP